MNRDEIEHELADGAKSATRHFLADWKGFLLTAALFCLVGWVIGRFF